MRVTIRTRYACRGCTDGVHQRPAPDRAIPGSLPTEALLVQVLVAKYGDGLPLYRQAAILRRQGLLVAAAATRAGAGPYHPPGPDLCR